METLIVDAIEKLYKSNEEIFQGQSKTEAQI